MLVECPQCGYALTGLPEAHRCPECGLAYDAHSEIFKHTNPKALIWSLVGTALAGLWVLSQSAAFTSALPPEWNWVSWLFVLGYVVIVMLLVVRLVHNYRRGPMVATMPDALWIRVDRSGDERIPWKNITRAVVNRATKGATLFIKPTRTTRDLTGLFRTPADAERFVEQVQARVAAAG